MVRYTYEENLADARAVGRMYLAIAKCPKPVIARVHGAALGGGAGLVAACDIGYGRRVGSVRFYRGKAGHHSGHHFSICHRTVGPGRAREFFITGERFLAPVAMNIGLIQHVVSHETALDALIESKISQILTSAPGAIAAAKELVFGVAARTLKARSNLPPKPSRSARAGAEGQSRNEGIPRTSETAMDRNNDPEEC